jgi:hypothetical protein
MSAIAWFFLGVSVASSGWAIFFLGDLLPVGCAPTMNLMNSQNDCSRWWGYSHVWGKWTEAEAHNIIRSHDKAIEGKQITQKRTCERCGLSEFKSTMLLVGLDD